ncbi:MAG: hypothetical protein ACE5JN_12975 [Candidatus Methylomirabilia bacterium]
MARLLIVVARDRFQLYGCLTDEAAGQRGMQVTLDRRCGERRQHVQAQESERRRADRRRQPVSANDLRSHGFVVTR